MIKGTNGERLTPTQAAKEILLDAAGRAAYWQEGFVVDDDELTERERQAISESIQKQFDRIQKFLGYEGWKLG